VSPLKTAISNIAWNLADDEAVASWMAEAGIRGVEIAPTKVWPKPLAVPPGDVAAYRRFWEERGIRIVAMQALLFGRPDLTLFESEAKRTETLEYLERIMGLAAALGAGPLVFGSPKNRKCSGLAAADVERIGVDFFRRAGDAAVRNGVVLCIEPNPVQYECDYVTNSKAGIELVAKVDHPGFRLHLDAAGMTLSADPLEASILAAAPSLCHFHVSEPFLGAIGKGGVRHDVLASTLRQVGYGGWVSVEMRFDPEKPLEPELRRVLALLRDVYGSG
jgi:sugar phosphate isomerase/epimerase